MSIEPGLWEIDAETYHSDPCDTPSLSNSLLKPLLKAPKKAWHAHSRLNPQCVPHESKRMDLGTVSHRLLLGKGRDYEVLDFGGYQSNAAKEARDTARIAGKTPILVDQFETATAMCQAAKDQLACFSDVKLDFSTDKFEVGLFWKDETGVWGRNLIDRISEDLTEVIDFKSTERSVKPDDPSLGAHVVDMGYDTQCAMQERGLLNLFPSLGGRIRFRWLLQETEAPYLISVVEPDAATMTMARKKVDYAFKLWAECLRTNTWLGYPQRVMPLRHSEYLANRWLEREIAESDDALAPLTAAFQGSFIPPTKRKPGRPKNPGKKSIPLTSLMGG